MSTTMVTPERQPIVLVFAADDRYAMPLAVAIHSALVNLRDPRKVILYIMVDGTSTDHKQKIDDVVQRTGRDVELQWRSMDLGAISDLAITKSYLTRAIFLRLLIPEVVAPHHAKALYMDCDVIVERNLAELWDQDVGDYALLAVRSFSKPYISSPFGVTNYRELKLPADAPYFNSGVLLLNLARWRQDQIGERAVAFLRRHPGRSDNDQEALNAVLVGQWRQLDARWNQIHNAYRLIRDDDATLQGYGYRPSDLVTIRRILEDVVHEPYIIHFTSTKPWKPNCYHPARNRFIHYLRETQWFTTSELVWWSIPRYWWAVRRTARVLRRRIGLRRPAFLTSKKPKPRRHELLKTSTF